MKTTAPANTEPGQRAASEQVRSRAAQKQAVKPSGHFTQLAAVVNASPRAKALTQMKDSSQQSSPVRNLMELAAEINQAAPVQLQGSSDNDGPALRSRSGAVEAGMHGAQPSVVQRTIDVMEWADLLTKGFDFSTHPFREHFQVLQEIVAEIGTGKIRAYIDEMLENKGNEEYKPSEEHRDTDRAIDALTDPLKQLNRAILESDKDVDAIHEVMKAFGLPVTKNIVRAVKAYNFNSEWINFVPENFLCWVNLATAQATIRDAQYLIHEAIEIGAILRSESGLNPFTTPKEYRKKSHTEQERLSDVFGGTDEEPALYDTAHLEALEYEYKFVAIQIHRLTGLNYSYRDVAAADPDRSEGREKLTAPESETTLGEDEHYAALGQSEVNLSSPVREHLSFGASGKVTLADLVRAVKQYRVAHLVQMKTAHGASDVVQRRINWVSGSIAYDNNLAEGLIVNRGYIGFTDPLINGKSMTRDQDFLMEYGLPKPKELRERAGDEEDEVTAYMAIDTVPVVNLGYAMHLPSKEEWTVTVSKEEAAAAIGRLDHSIDTSGLNSRVKFTVKGLPSDSDFLIHVLDHEFQHVFLTIDHIYDYLWDFDQKMERAKNQEIEVTGPSYDLIDGYWEKVIGKGGYQFLRGFHANLEEAQNAFHATPAGSYPKPTVTIVDPATVVVRVGGD